MKLRNAVFAALGALTCAALSVPLASADPEPVPADDCNASSLAKTVSSVTASLSDYFAAHPDANQALSDITRQRRLSPSDSGLRCGLFRPPRVPVTPVGRESIADQKE